MSKVVLDISMSLDGLIAQPDDAPGPIHEFFVSGETEHDGSFRTSGATTEVVRESIESAGAVITGRRTYDLTNGWEGNHPMRVPCFVVTHDVPTDVPDGPTQFTYVTDGIDSAVGQAKAVAGEKDVSIMGARALPGRRLRPSCSTRSRSTCLRSSWGTGFGFSTALTRDRSLRHRSGCGGQGARRAPRRDRRAPGVRCPGSNLLRRCRHRRSRRARAVLAHDPDARHGCCAYLVTFVRASASTPGRKFGLTERGGVMSPAPKHVVDGEERRLRDRVERGGAL